MPPLYCWLSAMPSSGFILRRYFLDFKAMTLQKQSRTRIWGWEGIKTCQALDRAKWAVTSCSQFKALNASTLKQSKQLSQEAQLYRYQVNTGGQPFNLFHLLRRKIYSLYKGPTVPFTTNTNINQ
jgi:hypothetical protein